MDIDRITHSYYKNKEDYLLFDNRARPRSTLTLEYRSHPDAIHHCVCLQFHHVEAWLLQRGTGRFNALRPWPTAVCHQHRRSFHSGYAALRPHLTSSRRPSLAADSRTYTLYLYTTVYSLHGSSTCYLQQKVYPVASMESRRRLRSVTSSDLMVSARRRSTLGDRAFAVAGPRGWNNFPDAIHHSPSLETFKRSLKSHLFLQCFLLSLSFLVFLW